MPFLHLLALEMFIVMLKKLKTSKTIALYLIYTWSISNKQIKISYAD